MHRRPYASIASALGRMVHAAMPANRVLRSASAAHLGLRRPVCSAIALISFLVLSLAYSSAFAGEHKRILILHSFSRDARPWSDYAKMIPAELNSQSPWPLDII